MVERVTISLSDDFAIELAAMHAHHGGSTGEGSGAALHRHMSPIC